MMEPEQKLLMRRPSASTRVAWGSPAKTPRQRIEQALKLGQRDRRIQQQATRGRCVALHTKLNMPDEDDVLGGVLGVWEHEDEEGTPVDVVEVVNFHNPYRPQPNPAARAIGNAMPLEAGSPLRYVRLPDLVALKLYAGGRTHLADIGELLVTNPEADVNEIRSAAAPYDRDDNLERLIAEASVWTVRSLSR